MKFDPGFKKFFFFVVMVLAAVGLILSAGMGLSGQGEKDKADKKTHKNPWRVMKKGAVVKTIKGTLRSAKSVRQIPLSRRATPRKKRPVLNLKRGRPIIKKETRQDPVVQRTLRGEKQGTLEKERQIKGSEVKGRQLAAPTTIIDFPGLDLANWGAGWPPDTTGDVGTTYFIQAVNTSFAFYRKSDGFRQFVTTFDDFFEGPEVAGTPCDEWNQGDPIVLYDQYADRWIIMDFAFYPSQSQGSWFSIAASQTGDPNGNWWLYAMPADNVLMNDYPKMGVWHDGIYMTANMFIFPNFGGQFQGVRIWALKTPELYNGTLTFQTLFDNSYFAWSLLPAHAKGPTPPSAGTPNYMIAMDASEYGPPSTDKLVVWEYDVDWATPANTTWSGPVQLPSAAFGLTASDVPQRGTSNTLDTLFGRLMFPAIYREFDGHAAMYVNHLAEFGGRRTKRWYEVRIDAGVPSIYQQSTYAPDSHHRWMGSVAADEDGNIGLGYSVSSTSIFPSIRFGARASIDPTLNVLNLGEGTIVNGTGAQLSTERWGDYSTITIDPVDDQTFWYTTEYYISTGTNWQTRIGSFKLKPDLWSRDSPDDTGEEPNTTGTSFWLSDDMWVRNQADGFVTQDHQNPEYGQTNYVYVRVRCREGEGSGRVKTYWAYAGTGLSWPGSWQLIGTEYTGTITLGGEEILEFAWDPPNPASYGSAPFCLWSRIETAPQAPWGMTFPEVTSFLQNVANNNNIIWKNMTIVDDIPDGGGSSKKEIAVANNTKQTMVVRLEFRSPNAASLTTTSSKTTETKSVLQWGTVKVGMEDGLYDKWRTKSAGTGVTVDTTRAKTIKITGSEAKIEDFKLAPGEERIIKVIFTPFTESANDKNRYHFDVVQY
ncbi:MAG: hypothetical protein GY940_12940, partial [bacterium]|nr:hypothetical protein [bacterium]